VFVTYNGSAEIYGLEASAQWRLGEVWQLHGALGLLESEIGDTESTRIVSPDAVRRDLAHAPGHTLNLGASFETPSGWFGRLDLNAIDAFYFDISHNQRSESYATVNLRLGKAWGPWVLSAWGRNLTDEAYFTRGFFFGNEPPAFENTLYTKFGDPRAYGLTLAYRYGD
jgi:outer membrane receptor protein involved in Fe transport